MISPLCLSRCLGSVCVSHVVVPTVRKICSHVSPMSSSLPVCDLFNSEHNSDACGTQMKQCFHMNNHFSSKITEHVDSCSLSQCLLCWQKGQSLWSYFLVLIKYELSSGSLFFNFSPLFNGTNRIHVVTVDALMTSSRTCCHSAPLLHGRCPTSHLCVFSLFILLCCLLLFICAIALLMLEFLLKSWLFTVYDRASC